jgi:uncharacterized protein YggE
MAADGRTGTLAGTGSSRRAVAALALAAALGAVGPAAAQETARTVTVTGRGEAAAVPDVARLTVGVSARRPDAAAAYGAAAEAAAAVVAALTRAGVAPADLRTADIGLGPHWTHVPDGPPRIEGYEAVHRLSVAVRAFDRLGPTLDAAAAAGATEIGGVRFDVSAPGDLLETARRAAVADARRAAAALAEAAGAALGAPLTIAENGHVSPAPMMRAQMADAAPMPVAPGETTVISDVTVTFALE